MIVSKRNKAPISLDVKKSDKNVSSLIYNEENVFVGFGVHNQKTLKTQFGIYKIINGVPRLSRFYYCGGANGIKVSVPDHAAPINWLQGGLERAATNKLSEGSYYLPLKAIKENQINADNLKLSLNLKSCVQLADFLVPAAVAIPFDIWVIDEIGAPNPIEEFEMDSEKLRRLITNRFLVNLWGHNPSLSQSWKNAVIRGQRLKQYLFGQEASIQLDAVQESLRQQVIEHAQSRWCDESGKLKFPWFAGHGAKLNRIIDFYQDLVVDGPVTLQRCASVDDINTPLAVGVVGSPVVVGHVDLPSNWKFPVTWKTSPFELNQEEFTENVSEPVQVEEVAA
jgi:hypothetical protein